MAEATIEHDAVHGLPASHGAPGEYEAPLFGAYSKKVGMWLFLASDSLTFGALLFAFSYNRIYTNPWPTPFHAESIANATIMTACLLSSSLTMVLGVFAAQRHDRAWTRNWLLAQRQPDGSWLPESHQLHEDPVHGAEQARLAAVSIIWF